MKVSVLLPTYNGSRFIARAIQSVLDQSYDDYEFLIINDGSLDHTGEIVPEFAARDDRIRYFRRDTNQGLEATLNQGLSLATGKYLARIDDDDYWLDANKLKMQVEFLDAHPGHALVGTGCVIMDENGKELSRYFPPETDQQIREVILRSNVFYHSTVMAPRDLVIRLGGYDTSYYAAGDYDLWLKLGTRGQLANLPLLAAAYTMRPGNICSRRLFTQLKDILVIINKYKGFYRHYYYSFFRRCLQYLLYATIGYPRYPRFKAALMNNIINQLYCLKKRK